MNITNTLWIVKKHDGSIYHNLNGVFNELETSPQLKALAHRILLLKKRGNEDGVRKALDAYYTRKKYESGNQFKQDEELKVAHDKLNICQGLIKFFSEFNFEPNFRFVNTLFYNAKRSYEQATNYCFNYFNLAGNDATLILQDKMQSIEWKQLVKMMNELPSDAKRINSRFKIYYGSQGTGKTTLAMKEASDVCMVCHSAMLPADLMKDFTFVDGKATFKKSSLRLAIEDGSKIVLDEINLLPLESLRFLQSLLDGKESFIFEGETIKVKDGFEIIGTMNLTVNGQVFGLPEPLIDRAYELRQFKLTADQLTSAL